MKNKLLHFLRFFTRWSSHFRSDFLTRPHQHLVILVEICICRFTRIHLNLKGKKKCTKQMQIEEHTKMCDMYFIISNYIIAMIHKSSLAGEEKMKMERERATARQVKLKREWENKKCVFKSLCMNQWVKRIRTYFVHCMVYVKGKEDFLLNARLIFKAEN